MAPGGRGQPDFSRFLFLFPPKSGSGKRAPWASAGWDGERERERETERDKKAGRETEPLEG
jgi:hypothetical protein